MFPLFDIPAKRAQLNPEKIALYEVESGYQVSYRQLNERAERFAEALQRLAIVHGDRIAILCHNNARFFEILFGCAKAGVVLVPLNWRLTPAELVPLLEDCQPGLLIHDQATAELAHALAETTLLSLIPILSHDAPVTVSSYQSLLAASTGERVSDPEWPSDGLWYMLYTSGTTGVPKAVKQTFGMAMANYINIGQAIDLTADDITPNFLPLFHTAGINLHSMPTLIAGGTVAVMTRFDPGTLLQLVDQGRLSALLAVPAVYRALSLHADFADVDLTRLRSWSSGGAPLPDDLVRQFAQRGVALCQGYGMTETGPTVFLMDQESVLNKLGSVGKPQLLSMVRVVDGEGNALPDGQAGELWIKGPNVSPGYWNRPEATAKSFDSEGWLHTGDVGRRDADGYFYIIDRIKDMYISGGENVYPAEVEKVLVAHPDVLDAAIIGVPDDTWGEVGRAYLIPRPDRDIDLDGLLEYARERLATYKLPRSFCKVEDFPRTPAGKVQKDVLRSGYLEGDWQG